MNSARKTIGWVLVVLGIWTALRYLAEAYLPQRLSFDAKVLHVVIVLLVGMYLVNKRDAREERILRSIQSPSSFLNPDEHMPHEPAKSGDLGTAVTIDAERYET